MKLRIKGHSIRLRLNRGEVNRLAGGESISEQTRFPGTAVLTYSIRKSASAPRIQAGFDGIELLVTLPEAIAREWSTGDRIGIQDIVPNGTDAGLQVLVEKDFACLSHREVECDAYPNPAAEKASG